MTKSQVAFRWIALLLALMLLVPLISCGGEGEVTPTLTTTITSAPTPTPGASAPPSTISSLSGEVLVLKSGSTAWVAAVAGMELEAGDHVKTGSGGTALLLFFEGSTMEIHADTEILINELSLAGTGSTNISLTQIVGTSVNRVQKLVDSESNYNIDTPAGSAVVRGTTFKVIVEGDGFTIVESEEGDVWLIAGGVATLIKTGQHSSAGPGSTPTNPLDNATPTPVQTPTPAPTVTATPLITPSPVTAVPGGGGSSVEVTPTQTPTPTPEITPSPTPEITPTPTPEITPTPTPEITPSPTPEITPSPTPEITPTPTPEITPSPTPEITPTPTPEITPSPTPEITPTPTPEITPSPTPEITPTPTPEITPSPTPEITPSPTPEITPSPTPSGYTLTVASQGCCPILVRNLPGGDQTVPAGANNTFPGIVSGTLVRLSAQVNGDTCSIYYWMIDGVRYPANPAVPADQTIYLTVNGDRTVTAVCGAPPPATPTPTPTPTPFVQVDITSPADGSTFTTRLITVLGTVVADNEITGATITHNGESHSLSLTRQGTEGYNYTFLTTLVLVQGSNSITVTATDSLSNSGSDTVTVTADIPIVPISIELTWDTDGTDVDSHLIAPCYAMWDSFGDCYFVTDNPDWDGVGGSGTDGDPSLDVDDTNGYGPENIVLVAPPFNGTYQYKVHYYSAHGHGPSTATVKIWINGVKVFEDSKTIYDGDVWDCACIDWPSGTVTAGPCATKTLTVTSQGCCPITVELPCGNLTVDDYATRTFYGLAQGSNVTLTPQTGEFCQFGNWTIDGMPPQEGQQEGHQLTITMDTNHTAIAACTPLYTLTVTNDGCWAISITGLPDPWQQEEWIEQNETREFPGIPEGTQVTLTHNNGDGIVLTGWHVDTEGSLRPDNPLVITMNANHQVTAVCVRVRTLDVSSNGCCPILVEGLPGGSQTVSAGNSSTFHDIPENTNVTLTAQPGGSCQFVNWVVDGQTNTNLTIVITMDSYHSVTAVCTPLHTLTVTSEGCCSIIVSWTGIPGGNQTVPAGGNRTFSSIPQGTEVTLEAVTEGNCVFDRWDIHSDEVTGDTKITWVTMNDDHTAICHSHVYVPTYNLLVGPQYGHIVVSWPGIPGGSQECVENEIYSFDIPVGTIVTLETEPEGGYYFYYWLLYWTLDDYVNVEIVNGNPVNLTMDRSYTVMDVCCTQPPSTLNVTSGGCCPIVVRGLPGEVSMEVPAGENGIFLCDPSIIVTLEAQGDLCRFNYWIVDDVKAPDSGNILELLMDENHTAVAVCSSVWLNEANGHYYELVNVDDGINWTAARDEAASYQFEGRQGHLATMTSVEENFWLTSTFTGEGLHLHWIGGYQPSGSDEPAGGWVWVTGEPWGFSNWWPGEPSGGENENYLIFDHDVTGAGKAWNDLNGTTSANGYVVEYEYLY